MLNHKDKRLWTVHEKQDLINRETYKRIGNVATIPKFYIVNRQIAHLPILKINTYKIMDKILFIGQNPKDFTCEEHYSSLKRIFKHGINLLGLLLLFLFVNITFVHAQAIKLSLNKQNATYEEIFNEIEERPDTNLFITHPRSTETKNLYPGNKYGSKRVAAKLIPQQKKYFFSYIK